MVSLNEEQLKAKSSCERLCEPYIRETWFRGAGIGIKNNKICIKINVRSEENFKIFPKEFEGYVVDVRAVGDISAL